MSIKRVATWLLITLLSLGFGLAALGKLIGAQDDMFVAWGYAAWFAKTVAILELIGVVLLLIPNLRKYSILLLTAIMIGAACTHIANGELLDLIRPAIFAAILWIVWTLQPKQKRSDEQT